ncbi:MAG: hypothetical protein QM690_08515 [Sphingobium sp.]
MFAYIGSHFPVLVVAAMTVFAAALAGFSIEDAVKARAARRDA